MENSMTRILIEAIVKKTLTTIKDSPERGIRNLVDMALQFSEGRFQKKFFATAQAMLQNENSAYYDLVRDAVNGIDAQRLLTFGMNLGYNGCTAGARRIRENEKKLACNIPWAVTILMDENRFEENKQRYHTVIQEGEELGVYVWMFFAADHPEAVLSLAEGHPDSAFCLFCQAKDLTAAFLDEASELHNVMLVVRYEESAAAVCDTLRRLGLLYSVWYQYGKTDTEAVMNGDLFCSVQQLAPVFTVLLPEHNCPKPIQDLIYETVKQARGEQTYRTLLLEWQGDNSLIDAVISDDGCAVYFDKNGDLCCGDQKVNSPCHNLFRSALSEIFRSGCAKSVSESA